MLYTPSIDWVRLNKRLSGNRIIKRPDNLVKKVNYLNSIQTKTCVDYNNLVKYKSNRQFDTFFIKFPKYFSTAKRKSRYLKLNK